ncbi:hypothetical protein H8A92_00505 [Bradyrhizobium sp. 10BB]|nr:hypothetical protein [Bradyrhizobium acaciae]
MGPVCTCQPPMPGIINEVRGVNRSVYDITSLRPRMIEWE